MEIQERLRRAKISLNILSGAWKFADFHDKICCNMSTDHLLGDVNGRMHPSGILMQAGGCSVSDHYGTYCMTGSICRDLIGLPR